MKTLNAFFLFIVLICSAPSLACRPKLIALEDRLKHAEGVYIGYVTGIELTEYEESLRKGESPSSLIYPESYGVRVFVTEVVLGSERSVVLAATSSGCGSVGPELKENVVVIVDPNYPKPYILRTDESLKEIRAALQNRANH